MIEYVVRCDGLDGECRRRADMPAGSEPAELAAVGWRIVRDEALCPDCAGRRRPPGESLRLSPPWTPAQLERVRRAAEARARNVPNVDPHP